MAEAGFWKRVSNLWSGFVSLWISDVEKNHPEIAYENAINSMVEKYAKLKHASAAIIRRRDDIKNRLEIAEKELKEVEQDLNAALIQDKRELGVILLQKQKSLQSSIEELTTESARAVKDAESAKSSLIQVQSEIKKLKGEKDRMLAQMASAQVRIRIQEQLEGLSVDAEVKALDNVRAHIKNTVAEANLNEELGETDLDKQLAALRKEGATVTAQSEWEQLRAASMAKAQKTI